MRKTLLTVCAVLALAAGAAAVETVSRTQHKSSFESKTETRRLELEVTGAHRSVRVSVKFRLTGGELYVKVRDPRGKVRQDIVLSRASKYEVSTGDMDAVPGLWTLEVSLREATGNYEAALEAQQP